MPAPTPTTLIDRVDDTDAPVGLIRREDVFEQGAGFRVAHVFVFDDQERLLLQRLGRRRPRHPLQWGSSVAGYLHAGETYEHAALRRLEEELGLTTPLRSVGKTTMLDEGARKFISLYTTDASQPHVQEPEHIEAIEFVPLDVVGQRIASDPRAFTATFVHLFEFYVGEAD